MSPGRGGGTAAARGLWLDVCSAQMAPRVALVVVLLTILLVAWQLLVSCQGLGIGCRAIVPPTSLLVAWQLLASGCWVVGPVLLARAAQRVLLHGRAARAQRAADSVQQPASLLPMGGGRLAAGTLLRYWGGFLRRVRSQQPRVYQRCRDFPGLHMCQEASQHVCRSPPSPRS